MHKAAALLDPRRSLGSPILIGPAIAMALAAGTILYGAYRHQDVDHHASIMQASAPRPTARTISSDALPHVAGKNITTMVVEFPPGGFSPPHHHGGSVTVYVLDGTIRSQLQGGPAMVYTEGQTFFEPPGIVHLLAENVSTTEPARILAVFVADEGATLTTYHE
jgi:quercetin dioxygenase-like cupin family protein